MDLDARPILLVEDDRKDVELILNVLQESNIANGVDTVFDGEEALDYIYRRGRYSSRGGRQPVAVILDLKLPKIDGIEVLNKLKSDPILKSLPIIMFTSSHEETDIIKSYKLGANAYVVKPVEFEEFSTAIRELGLFWTVVNHIPNDGI